jgi:hypothetical protein
MDSLYYLKTCVCRTVHIWRLIILQNNINVHISTCIYIGNTGLKASIILLCTKCGLEIFSLANYKIDNSAEIAYLQSKLNFVFNLIHNHFLLCTLHTHL